MFNLKTAKPWSDLITNNVGIKKVINSLPTLARLKGGKRPQSDSSRQQTVKQDILIQGSCGSGSLFVSSFRYRSNLTDLCVCWLHPGSGLLVLLRWFCWVFCGPFLWAAVLLGCGLRLLSSRCALLVWVQLRAVTMNCLFLNHLKHVRSVHF